MTTAPNTGSATSPHPLPAAPDGLQAITLGGGCFWCTEGVFDQVRGVTAVESGYANGHVDNPGYERVCGGNTGHAEVIRVTFDPAVVPLSVLLEIFFATHDPTTLNRQGNDVGTQYRSGIYFQDPAHEATAREVLAQVQAATRGKAVTEIEPLRCYWPAEAYHQHYFANHPDAGYCAFVVEPKVQKFRKTFAAWQRG